MATDNRLLEKLRKVLALTTSPNENEAAARQSGRANADKVNLRPFLNGGGKVQGELE